jgi:hypothetical protein
LLFRGAVNKNRSQLLGYLPLCGSEGVWTGEFEQVPAEETTILIISVTNGVIHYRKGALRVKA